MAARAMRFPRVVPGRRALGAIAFWAFAAQGLARIVWLMPFLGLTWSSPVVHAMTLAALLGLAVAVQMLAPLSRVARALIALVLGAAWLVLCLFDANALISTSLYTRPVTFEFIAFIYCGKSHWSLCSLGYPLVAAALAAALVVFAGLMFCALAYIERHVQRITGRGRGYVLLAIALVWLGCGLAWQQHGHVLLTREPLTYQFYEMGFTDGPVELLHMRRPVYAVQPTPAAKPQTLVLITVDALRADAVGLDPAKPTRTPFLRTLAQSGKLTSFGPAAAICPQSFCGILALHSSGTWASLKQGSLLMLADVLAANGYQNHFLLSGSHRGVTNFAALYGPKVTSLQDDLSPDFNAMMDDREQIVRLDKLAIADPARTFLSIHLMSAHSGGRRFDTPGRSAMKVDVYRRDLLPIYRDYYADGVAQADYVISRIFAILRAKGLLENAMVVITADHGERLVYPRGTEPHRGEPDADTIAIPILVWQSQPGLWPTAALASTVDVAPTLLDAIGIAPPAAWQGQSLLRGASRAAVAADSFQSAGMVGLVSGRRVLFRCTIKTGTTIAMALDGAPLSAAEQAAALARAPLLYAGLLRRSDAGPCYVHRPDSL